VWIRFGTSLYGKVDVVPGLGFVSTKFFHVMLLPIVPLGCWFVEEGSEGKDEHGNYGWRGVNLPFNVKSVLFAYGRVWALVGSGVLALIAIPGLAPTAAKGWLAGIGSACCLAAVYLSYRFNRASLPRAVELGEIVGVPADEVKERYRRLAP
jgi:hypothetical protein